MENQQKSDLYTPIIMVLISILTLLVVGNMIVKGLV